MTIEQLKTDRRIQLPATAVTIGLTLLFPFIVHTIGGPTAGARWLPLFYAPFIAVVLFHPAVSLIAGLATPFLNHWLTGAPPWGTAVLLSVELVIFAAACHLLRRRWPRLWVAAPLAYLLALALASLLLVILPGVLIPAAPGAFFTSTLPQAWPGLLVLLLLNWLMVKGIRHAG